jgi:uracil-DNA glycosylase
LAQLIGVDEDTFIRGIVWISLFDHSGSDPAKYVEMVDRASSPSDAIILVGRRVARVYGMESLGPLAVVRRHGGMGSTVVSVPSPSSLNRWWNSRDHQLMAARTLRKIWSEHQ